MMKKITFLLFLSALLLFAGCSEGPEFSDVPGVDGSKYFCGTLTDFSSTGFTFQKDNGSTYDLTLAEGLNLEAEDAAIGDEICGDFIEEEDEYVAVNVFIHKTITGTLEKIDMDIGTFAVRTADDQLYQFEFASGASLHDAVEGDTVQVQYTRETHESETCYYALSIE